jgi:NADH:ubiquinone oxidoreductase subunit H
MLLYSCLLMPILFLRFFLPCSPLILRISALFLRFFFIWIRITFCRYRYDILITTSWKVLLPSAINLFLFFQLLLLFLI